MTGGRSWTAAAAGAVGGLLSLAGLLGGAGGLLVAATAVWLAALLAVRASLRTSREPVPAPADVRARTPGSPFPSFAAIEQALSWGAVSRRHFDTGLRPLLWRLALARVMSHEGVDEQAAARRIEERLGADLWPWLEPVWPPSRDSEAPGVDPRVLAALVERLEDW